MVMARCVCSTQSSKACLQAWPCSEVHKLLQVTSSPCTCMQPAHAVPYRPLAGTPCCC